MIYLDNFMFIKRVNRKTQSYLFWFIISYCKKTYYTIYFIKKIKITFISLLKQLKNVYSFMSNSEQTSFCIPNFHINCYRILITSHVDYSKKSIGFKLWEVISFKYWPWLLERISLYGTWFFIQLLLSVWTIYISFI